MVQSSSPLTAKLVDALYVEAMLLADEARSYFDGFGRDARDELDAASRVGFSCESLKVTTRLMHSIAWLLSQRAILAGDMSPDAPSARLGRAQDTDSPVMKRLPEEARILIVASEDLYNRIARLDRNMHVRPTSPARHMQENLARMF